MVWKNLRNSFPEKSDADLKSIEKKFYKNLCDYAVETLKLVTIRKEELAKRMVYEPSPEIDSYKDKNQSVLVLAAHQFNWEWLVAASDFSLPMPNDFVYQPQNNKFFNHFSLVGRTRFGSYPIKRDEVARELIKRKDMLRTLAIVADQYPGYKKDKKFEATFLNQDTVFFYGANQMAIMTQYPVFFAQIKKIKRGYYKVSLLEIATPPYEKQSDVPIRNYIQEVERLIQQHPSNWLWSHNRWKKRHLKYKQAIKN